MSPNLSPTACHGSPPPKFKITHFDDIKSKAETGCRKQLGTNKIIPANNGLSWQVGISLCEASICSHVSHYSFFFFFQWTLCQFAVYGAVGDALIMTQIKCGRPKYITCVLAKGENFHEQEQKYN